MTEKLLDSQSDIVVRHFVVGSADDAACKALEAKASMIPKAMRWLVNGQFVHHSDFNRKVSQFPDGLILVAESSSEGIVGMIVGGLKRVYLQPPTGTGGDPVQTLYMFDLRIAASHQSHGLGKRLVEEMQREAFERGARYVYLSVNNDNTKAQKLFEKLGYSECSVRFPMGQMFSASAIRADAPLPQAVKVERVDGEAASVLLASELQSVDLLPADLSSLVASPFYLGTFVARYEADGTSLAAISLWDSSRLTSFRLTHFIVPAGWYKNPQFRYSFFVVVALLFALWPWHIYELLSQGSYMWGVLHSLGLAFVGFVFWKLRPGFRFLFAMLNAGGQPKIPARLCLPCQRGPRGAELVSSAVVHALGVAKGQGFVSWICNLDKESPLRAAIPGPGNFVTKFMHKWLDGSQGNLARLSTSCIHDPRDT